MNGNMDGAGNNYQVIKPFFTLMKKLMINFLGESVVFLCVTLSSIHITCKRYQAFLRKCVPSMCKDSEDFPSAKISRRFPM